MVLMLYGTLRLWFHRSVCFLAALLFAACPPFAAMCGQLMTRHYVEGLFFFLLGIFFFVRGIRDEKPARLLISSFCYLLAMLCKEIFVPLGLVVLFLPDETTPKRRRAFFAWAATLLVYLVWRHFMMSRFAGAYGLELSARDVLLLVPRLVAVLGGDSTIWVWVAVVSVTGCLLVFLALNRRGVLFSTVTAALLVGPLIPVSPMMSYRHAYVLSLGLVLFHVAAWNRLLTSMPGRAVRFLTAGWVVAILAAFLFVSSVQQNEARQAMVRQREEGSFILDEGSSTDVLVHPMDYSLYFQGLSWLRREVRGLGESPSISLDGRLLCFHTLLEGSSSPPYNRFWSYDQKQNTLVSRTPDVFCADTDLRRIRKDAPLTLRLVFDNGYATWRTGPYRRGRYAFLFGRYGERLHSVPRKGGLPVNLPALAGSLRETPGTGLPLRLRYEAPGGWVTYSQLLTLEFSENRGELRWQRK